MDKNLFENLSKEAVELIRTTSLTAEKEDIALQKERIKKESAFSQEINNAFSGYEEFEFLNSLELKEAMVTRKSLIRKIDFDLFITCKQKTNYELMLEGSSPYLTDNPDDSIVIHHIGQSFNSPFAELSFAEHSRFGNSKLLHNTKIESWRNDPSKKNQFQLEKSNYWKQRARREITYISKDSAKSSDTNNNYKQKNIIVKIKQPLEKIFSACSIEDLKYISNLANGYILTKQVGGKTIEEFILNSNSELMHTIKCPKCKSKKFIYYGYQETSHERKQRYQCKECGNVFSLFRNTIISGCNLSFMQWIQFIDCLYNGYSLEKTSRLCDISIQAAFDNRLRLFYALKILEQKVVLKGNIVIDETYILASHKGNRSEQSDFELIRLPRKRGGENHVPGTSKEQVCIVCALDSYNNSVAKIAGLGAPTAQKIDLALKDHLDKENVLSLYSDQSHAIKRFADINSFSIEQARFVRKKASFSKPWINRYIQKINSYHSRLKRFITSFNGVSSELLEGYMCLFSWKDRNRDKEPMDAYKELLNVMLTPGLYKSVDQIVKDKIIESAVDFENRSLQNGIKINNYKRSKEIYDRWNRGERMQDIADSLGVSKQRVHQIIDEFRKKGYAYTTEFEKKRKERRTEQQWQDEQFAESQITFQRNYAIYLEKASWKGSNADFYEMASQKYGLSIMSIKNRLSEVKRIIDLRKTFYVYEEYKHLSLKEMFELIFKKYVEISNARPTSTKTERYKIIAEEFGYKEYTIFSIINNIEKNEIEWENKAKIKTPLSQGLNRDISVFIDFMKWTGSRKKFFDFTKEKYGISKITTQKILQMNYLADPKRFEITKMY